ncbi:MAG: VOC family protein [Vicinamibacterales bacterium]|nr:VOC family protein [Vicinamibacterales bacterium]
MVTNGIDRIKVSVYDMDESVAFFRDTLEMTVVSDVSLAAEPFQRLWELPAGTTARSVCLGNGEQSTLVELVAVSPNSGRYIRDGARTYDYGLLDIAFRAKDLAGIYEDLRQRGHTFVSAPVVYTADWAKVTVVEVIVIGPNKMPVALIERLSEPKPVIRGRFGTMVDVAQYVPSMESCAPFYTDLLGYTSVFDADLPPGLIDEVVALPPGSTSRLNLMYQPHTKTPAVELIASSAPGTSLAPVVHPANLGLFAMVFETADLGELLRRVGDAGFAVVAGPVEYDAPVHGRVVAATVRGPNDVWLEFFSR